MDTSLLEKKTHTSLTGSQVLTDVGVEGRRPVGNQKIQHLLVRFLRKPDHRFSSLALDVLDIDHY